MFKNPTQKFTNSYYIPNAILSYNIRNRKVNASEYRRYSHLLDQEIDLNDIIIKDTFETATEEQIYWNFNRKPKIDTDDVNEYFEFIVEDFEFKKNKFEKIGIKIGIHFFPNDLKDLPITQEYFSKQVCNIKYFLLIKQIFDYLRYEKSICGECSRKNFAQKYIHHLI